MLGFVVHLRRVYVRRLSEMRFDVDGIGLDDIDLSDLKGIGLDWNPL